MSTLSLLDAIERPSILGFDREMDSARERERGRARERDGRGHVPTPFTPPVGGGPTLDDLLTGTWETLAAGRTAACPMCAGPMEPRYGHGHAPVGGRCGRCATEIS